jgi:hypothetical protein
MLPDEKEVQSRQKCSQVRENCHAPENAKQKYARPSTP